MVSCLSVSTLAYSTMLHTEAVWMLFKYLLKYSFPSSKSIVFTFFSSSVICWWQINFLDKIQISFYQVMSCLCSGAFQSVHVTQSKLHSPFHGLQSLAECGCHYFWGWQLSPSLRLQPQWPPHMLSQPEVLFPERCTWLTLSPPFSFCSKATYSKNFPHPPRQTSSSTHTCAPASPLL